MLASWEEHGTKSHELEVAQAQERGREFTSVVYKKKGREYRSTSLQVATDQKPQT
jgi:hypothetical protein